MEAKTPISINVCACICVRAWCVHVCVCICACDKVTKAGHSTVSPHKEARPLINVLSAQKDRRGKEQPQKGGRERRRGGGRVGDAWVSKYWRSTTSEKGFPCRGCFIFRVWFFTSERLPVCSTRRSGGNREIAASAHPRTSLRSQPLLLHCGLREKTDLLI